MTRAGVYFTFWGCERWRKERVRLGRLDGARWMASGALGIVLVDGWELLW
jgi:hypothetical protein